MVILIKNGELALKGLNRSTFEDILVKNIKRRLMPLGVFSYKKAQSTITITPESEVDFDEVIEKVSHVFGIAAFSVAQTCEKDIDEIKKTTIEFLGEKLRSAKTFKVCAKRADKKFPYKSPEICNEIGGHILANIPRIKVDVHNPEVTVNIEVRDSCVYIHADQIKGAGGMPVGSSGRAIVMLSGGIDSPVAAYMMAKRGVELFAIHFASPPYTSKRAEMKVKKLAEIVEQYSGRMRVFVVHFTELQEAIRDYCPEELFTVVMRRMMMRIAQKFAAEKGAKAIITGESLGQVASQTMDAIACTDAVSEIPVFRPCIGLDKSEIIDIAKKIGTFETSLEPFEDCCTVFTPKHPRTRPTQELLIEAEKSFDFEKMIEEIVIE